jgi:succinyl-CoA synthetase beta subunit
VRLKEYQAKRLLKKYGIAIPKGKLIRKPVSAPKMLAKAQVTTGSRLKNGLILPATEKNLRFLFQYCSEVLLEEKLPIEKEYYLALAVDSIKKEVIIIFTQEGGIEVENSVKIKKIRYGKLDQFPRPEFLPIIKKLHRLMRDYQALLVEINPLARSSGKLIALDAKVILDDNVSHREFRPKLTSLEKWARKSELVYVELNGNIGVIGNGAGLVMATLDLIDHFGGKAANFLDLGGGATSEKMTEALKIVLAKKPRALLINIFGGITRCDEITRGIINYKNKSRLRIPLVVRMIGTNEENAKKILAKNKIQVYDLMEDAAKAITNVYHR